MNENVILITEMELLWLMLSRIAQRNFYLEWSNGVRRPGFIKSIYLWVPT